MNRNRPARRARGVSLVEASVVIGVLAIIVGSVAPSLTQLRQKVEIEGIANQLETDIQFTRFEAVARAQSLRLTFAASAGGSCYVVHTGAAGDCRCGDDGRAECAAGAQALKTLHLPASGTVRLQSNAGSMLFDGTRGTISPTGTVRVIGSDGRALHQVVNVMGRIRTCAPQRSIPGYRTC
jgi:type IV fimbrial biogenesis protein FimT